MVSHGWSNVLYYQVYVHNNACISHTDSVLFTMLVLVWLYECTNTLQWKLGQVLFMLYCPVPSAANRCCPLSTQDTVSRGWSHSGGRVQSQEPSTTTPSPAPSSPPSMYTIVPWTPVTMEFLIFMNFYRHSLFSVLFEEHIVPCIQWSGDSACPAASPMTQSA